MQVATPEEMIKGVREHSLANYANGGWDVVVEAWEDKDIVNTIGKAWTVSGAIAKVGAAVSVYESYSRDIQGA